MAEFNLTTTWHIPSSFESCWFCILDVEAWPDWWKYVKQVSPIASGDQQGVGYIYHYTWNTRLPYQLAFNLKVTKTIPYRQIHFTVNGDLIGQGQCLFNYKNNQTIIQFKWHVKTTKKWMSALATIAYPIFIWNHKQVMLTGEKNLIARLQFD